MAAIRLTRTHRILIGVVVAGAVVIAGIGFAGSYAAVRTLALHKGFGWFANVFPVGVDAGIVVLLALDLLLTWLRIPFPLLRQTAWLLTGATIAFNGAAAWPDPLGVGMHAIIPVLFVVSVEAARHAIGRVADITADKHMESVRITRWLLAPVPTFRLWRRMKLWELRSYEEVIRREQDRLVYRARLRARYGVAWRRKAPVEAIMPLRLAKYGVPLADTADAGLQAAGIEVMPYVRQLEAAPAAATASVTAGREASGAAGEHLPGQAQSSQPPSAQAQSPQARSSQQPRSPQTRSRQELEQDLADAQAYAQQAYAQREAYERQLAAERRRWEELGYQGTWQGAPHDSPWFDAEQHYANGGAYPYPYPYDPRQDQQYAEGGQFGPVGQVGPGAGPDDRQERVMVPAGPEHMRPLGNGGAVNGTAVNGAAVSSPAVNGTAAGATIPGPRREEPYEQYEPHEGADGAGEAAGPGGFDGYGPQDAPEAFRAAQQAEAQMQARMQAEAQMQAQQVQEARSRQAQAAGERRPAPPEQEFRSEAEIYPVAGMELPDGVPPADAYFAAYRSHIQQHGTVPGARQLVRSLSTLFEGTPPEERDVVHAIRALHSRSTEAEAESIP